MFDCSADKNKGTNQDFFRDLDCWPHNKCSHAYFKMLIGCCVYPTFLKTDMSWNYKLGYTAVYYGYICINVAIYGPIDFIRLHWFLWIWGDFIDMRVSSIDLRWVLSISSVPEPGWRGLQDDWDFDFPWTIVFSLHKWTPQAIYPSRHHI